MKTKAGLLFAFCFFFAVSLSQNKQLIQEFEKALNEATHDSVRIKYLNELSWEWSEYNFDLSKSYARRALELSVKINDMKAMASAYNMLASVFDYSAYYDSSLIYYEKALQLRKFLRDNAGEANILNNLGISFYFRGLMDEALIYYLKAATIRERIHDTIGYAKSLNNIGIIYRTTGDFKNAILTYRKSLEIKKLLNDIDGVYMSYTNFIVAFQGAKAYDSAFYYADKALLLARQKNEPTYIAAILGNKASLYKDIGELDKSISHLNEAMKMFEGTDNRHDEVSVFVMLGDVYALKKEYGKALDWYKKGLSISRSLQRNEVTLKILSNLSKTYSALKKFEEALAYQNEYLGLKESLDAAANEKQLNQLKTKFQTEIKEKEIARAKVAQNLTDLQLEKKSKDLRNTFILIGILSLLVIVALYFFIRIRSASKRIKEQNKKIAIALGEKETLLKEIHHRVKNNLQIISGLLELQESLNENSASKKMIDEAQSRIKSMSITHELLYQNSDLSAVNLEEYVQRLTESIEVSFLRPSLGVEKNFALKDVSFPIDTIIPIGLILNELLTNSYKYAFSETGSNSLTISIRKHGESWELTYRDSGPGLPEQLKDMTKQKTFGLRLVNMLIRQLAGTCEYRFENSGFFVFSFRTASA